MVDIVCEKSVKSFDECRSLLLDNINVFKYENGGNKRIAGSVSNSFSLKSLLNKGDMKSCMIPFMYKHHDHLECVNLDSAFKMMVSRTSSAYVDITYLYDFDWIYSEQRACIKKKKYEGCHFYDFDPDALLSSCWKVSIMDFGNFVGLDISCRSSRKDFSVDKLNKLFSEISEY